MSKNKNMSLEKGAQEQLKDGQKIPTIKPKKEKKPWDEVKKNFTPSPDMIAFLVPEKTDSGIILPDGKPLIDDDEYRPKAEICGEEVEFINPGDCMVLHSQAQQAAVPLKLEGHAVYMIHQQFVVGKTSPEE